jgi:hypothetical protein
MKKNTVLFFLVMVLFLVGNITNSYAQRIIEPNEGYVNELIKADTANGKQKNTVYVFRRNATYYYNGSIENVGYAITLKAEDGTGTIPKIVNWPDANASLNRFLTAKDDAYLFNLMIDGMGQI